MKTSNSSEISQTFYSKIYFNNINNCFNLKTTRVFTTISKVSYPRTYYEDRSESKLCRYDVLTHHTNKEIMLREIINKNYDKDNWGNHDQEKKVSIHKAYDQLRELKETRDEVDNNRYLNPFTYEKARVICEKNPSTFNNDYHPFPDYDGNVTPWTNDKHDNNNYSSDNDNNDEENQDDNNNSSTGPSSSPSDPGPSGTNTNQSNFLDYILITFFYNFCLYCRLYWIY